MPLEFEIAEICEEIRYLRDAASDLLDPSAAGVLHVFEQSLQSIQWHEPGHVIEWELPQDQPLITRMSYGEFQFNGKRGPHECFAEISCMWNITPIMKRKERKPSIFKVAGIASVHVNILELQEDGKALSLGSWRMELGDSNAPGCFFHVQILGEKARKVCPWPHSLDVPRLPSILFTPMAVTEFVLSELFQDEWSSLKRQSSAEIRAWGRIQKRRLRKLFEWHGNESQDAPESPWSYIKRRIPDADWFIRE